MLISKKNRLAILSYLFKGAPLRPPLPPLTGRAHCHTAACADAWSPAGDWGGEGEEGSNAASVVWTLARARLWPWASL